MEPEKLADIPDAHRQALLERLVVHILADGQDDPEAETSISVITRIVDTLEVNERRELADRFAHAERAPQTLIRRFSCDLVFVADPVLRWSNHIDAAFLGEIIAEISDEHLQVVAQRGDLSRELAEMLIQHGSAKVHKKVALNTHVPLTKKMLVRLFKSAARQRAVEEALCGREDLPEEASAILMQRVGRRLQNEVGDIAQALQPTELRLALRTGDADNSEQESDTRGLSLDSFVMITRLAQSGGLKPEHLLDFAKRRDLGAVIACFAHLAGVHPTLARRLVLQPSSEGLAVAARAAELDREVLEALAELRREMHLSDALPESLTKTFGDVGIDAARTIMTINSRRSKSLSLHSSRD